MIRRPFSLFCWMMFMATFPIHAQLETGGEFSWARLKTEYRYWNRHANGEPMIVKFIGDHTNLEIEEKWEAVNIRDLEGMVQYPFLFSEGIHTVKDDKALNNLREYLLRGGFLMVDSCINPRVTKDPDVFVRDHIALMKELLPDAQVKQLPEDHMIFRIFFTLKKGTPPCYMGGTPHSYMRSVYDPAWDKHGFYIVYHDEAPVSLISVSGLKCGWSNANRSRPGHNVLSSKMMVNIYVWAMTR